MPHPDYRAYDDTMFALDRIDVAITEYRARIITANKRLLEMLDNACELKPETESDILMASTEALAWIADKIADIRHPLKVRAEELGQAIASRELVADLQAYHNKVL